LEIYPMYDYAHGESDYVEQISHSNLYIRICDAPWVIWLVLDQIYDENKVRPHQWIRSLEP
jgi:glutaminyl-tRNA synthetase